MSFDEQTEANNAHASSDIRSQSVQPRPYSAVAAVAVAGQALAACGGSADGGTAATAPGGAPAATTVAPSSSGAVTGQSAARFLAQSTMGAAPDDGAAVIAKGYDGWLSDQFNMPREISFYDWLVAKGYGVASEVDGKGFTSAVWKQLIGGKDQLRQRVGAALLSILVVGYDGVNIRFPQCASGAYLDILWDNAFGNFRTILEKVSTNAAMSWWLSFLENWKSHNGSLPDENYARELMQLFTIGLYQLNPDGTQKLSGGRPIETYTQADVSGLARVFTGWSLAETYVTQPTNPEYVRQPLRQSPWWHETGAKSFLGVTIPANTSGEDSLKIVIDTLFAHPNVPPFISKQLIQRLVTSNPTPAYVQRVASVFENNGSGVRGDLRAVVRAILLDTEARNDSAAQTSTSFGKLREPVMRFTAWARAFGAKSASDTWAIPDTSSTSSSLSQMAGRSPSVFNWFRPGYTPGNSAISSQSMVAPEFQIVSEPSVISYIDFMSAAIEGSYGDFKADYTAMLAKAADSQALLNEINLLLAANQVGAATIAQIKTAVDSIASDTSANLQKRVSVAVLLILASPEFITLK